MENLVTETVADQGLGVGSEDETRLVSALPRNPSDEVILEKLTNDDTNAVDAEASGADVIVDLVHGIESLKKDDARARLLELEEDQEKTFFEIGGVLSAIQKNKWFDPYASLDEWVKKSTGIKRSKAGLDSDLRRHRQIRGQVGQGQTPRLDQVERHRGDPG